MPDSLHILITRRMPASAGSTLHAAGHPVDAWDHDDPMPRPEFLERVRGAAGIICMLSEPIDEATLAAAGGSLRVVANYAVGFDNIDLAACTRRGIQVTNTPGVLTHATADLAWSLILACARRTVEGDALVRSGGWTGWTPTQLLGLELRGATLGIVGAGRIGTATAMRSRGFEMRVLYAHRRQNELLERELGAERVELEQLLGAADIVSLHIPMRPENRHLINRAAFERMKPTAILVNTARGPIVDEEALVETLRARRIMAAGLDVYEHEPKLTSGLAELPNAVLLPHLGSGTTATRDKMARMAAANVIAVLAGRPAPNPVNQLV